MIRLSNIVKKFDNKNVLDHLDIKIELGEMVAVTGKSGSGKSTLLNVIGFLEKIDEGNYEFEHYSNVKPNSKLSNKIIREKVSYIFQNYALIDDQTVLENLKLAQKYLKKNKKEKEKEIKEVLERVGLSGLENKKIFQLSGGQQQRVSIARCLIKPSELILADEPTGSLDELNKKIIIDELKKLNKLGKTVIIVTHDPEVAQSCSREINLDTHSEK